MMLAGAISTVFNTRDSHSQTLDRPLLARIQIDWLTLCTEMRQNVSVIAPDNTKQRISLLTCDLKEGRSLKSRIEKRDEGGGAQATTSAAGGVRYPVTAYF